MRPGNQARALESEYCLLHTNSSILAIVRARQDILGEVNIPGVLVSEESIDTPEPGQWWIEGVPRAVVVVMLEQLKARIAKPSISWDQVRAEAERREITPAKMTEFLFRS